MSSKFFHCQVATPFYFFHVKPYGYILTGTPWEFSAGGIHKNCDSQPISGFITCCQRFDHNTIQCKYNTMSIYQANLEHCDGTKTVTSSKI